ncbi:MAG: MFS transporter, partial [Eubacteriales bacterium]
PLEKSIGMSLIKDKNTVGKWLGTFGGVKTAFNLVAGLIVFFGFRFGVFSFTTKIKWIFVLSGGFTLVALLLLVSLNKRIGTAVQTHRKIKLVFDKDYKFYYILAVLYGAQKQIALVFGPWVLIEILSKGADTLSVLNMLGGFACMFFVPAIGRYIDKIGIKKMLYFDAVTFIGVYILYGFVSGLFADGKLALVGLPIFLAYGLYILDMMSESMDIIRVSYLRSIAKSSMDITHTLTTGMSMDHVVSILCAYLGGIVWTKYGPQYVFYAAAIISLANLVVAIMVKIDHPVHITPADIALDELND